MSTAEYRKRIATLNGNLNAFVDETDETGGGLAWGVKSNIAVKGLPLTAGIGAYKTNVAIEDALVVERIRSAGGVVLGALNMHEGALGATTDNKAFGRTQNPWRDGYTPGGSSGGSASAVAAGLCDIALGSDTMGSVRIPAAYCGVYGHKPTTGLVPDNGVLALSPTLDHVGPLARDVATLWRGMHVLADWGVPGKLVRKPLSGLRLGIWLPDHENAMEPDVRASLAAALEQASLAGAKLTPFAPPAYVADVSRRAGLLISEVEAYRIHAQTMAADPDGFSDEFKRMMEWGIRQPAEKVESAFSHVNIVRAAAQDVWNHVDFVIAPTAPQAAFSFEAAVPKNQSNFTAWANLAALPATAVFSGLNACGLPLSLQVIGPEGADRETLQTAAAFETLLGKAPRPAGYE